VFVSRLYTSPGCFFPLVGPEAWNLGLEAETETVKSPEIQRPDPDTASRRWVWSVGCGRVWLGWLGLAHRSGETEAASELRMSPFCFDKRTSRSSLVFSQFSRNCCWGSLHLFLVSINCEFMSTFGANRWNFRFWALRRCKPERSLQFWVHRHQDGSAFQHVGSGSFCEDGGDLLEGATTGTAVYSSCTVPKSVSCTEKHSPKSLLTLGFSEVPRWDHSNFSSFHHIKLVTYPMILYDIICMIIRLSAWYPNCKLLDYPSLSSRPAVGESFSAPGALDNYGGLSPFGGSRWWGWTALKPEESQRIDLPIKDGNFP